MGNNRQAKEELIRRYGAECFIERLKIRDTSNLTYTGKGQYRKMKMLTYHHIRQRSKGGQATIENGAVLSNENHIWFHKLPREKQIEINKKFQEFKKEVDELKIEYVDDIDVDFKVVASFFSVDEREKINMSEKEKGYEIND